MAILAHVCRDIGADCICNDIDGLGSQAWRGEIAFFERIETMTDEEFIEFVKQAEKYPSLLEYNPLCIEMNPVLDVLSSLEELERCLDVIIDEGKGKYYKNRAYKWIVLSLHSAIQGTLVCYLTHGDGTGALNESSEKKLRAWHDGQRQRTIKGGLDYDKDNPMPWSESRLETPKWLWERLVKRLEEQSKDTQLLETGEWSYNTLCDLRNDFTHFKDHTYCIDMSDFPVIIRSTIQIIRRFDGGMLKISSVESLEQSQEQIKSLYSRLSEKADALDGILSAHFNTRAGIGDVDHVGAEVDGLSTKPAIDSEGA